MAINKVVDRNDNVLIDLTHDTIKPNKVMIGQTFHDASGELRYGEMAGVAKEIDKSKYTFIDYDGTILHEYTDDEIDALTELPEGPDHTDEDLVFEEWNWDLASLKAFNRARPDRPIVGPSIITSDEKTYIGIKTSPSLKETINMGALRWDNVKFDIDWGDGTVENVSSSSSTISKTHTYATAGEYVITITPIENTQSLKFGSNSTNTASLIENGSRVTFIKLGKIGYLDSFGKLRNLTLEKINIPKSVRYIETYCFNYSSIKTVIVPNNIEYVSSTTFGFRDTPLLETISFPADLSGLGTSATFTGYNLFSLKNLVLPDNFNVYFSLNNSYSLKTAVIPDGFTNNFSFQSCGSLEYVKLGSSNLLAGNALSGCALKSIEIPDSVTSIGTSAFQSNFILEKVVLPDSVKTLNSNCFSSCYSLTLDLSKQTKVIALTSSIGLSTSYNQILVPIALLDQYKNASYWSNYASIMVGV